MTTLTFNAEHLPKFTKIHPDRIEPQLTKILSDNESAMKQWLCSPTLNWNNLVQKLLDSQEHLDNFWSPIGHLHSVADNDALRASYNRCLPLLTEYLTKIGQNEDIYNALKQIAASKDFETLSFAEHKVIHDALRDYQLSGVSLSPTEKSQYLNLQTQLSLLTTQFEENLLDATRAWAKNITNPLEMEGIPEHIQAAAVQEAKKRQQTGWTLTLDFPVYHGVICYADSQALRKEFYTAYITRASEVGPNPGQWDNTTVMTQIMEARYQLATLLGFKNYAELSLATKMAKTPQEVIDFLQELAKHFHGLAVTEFQELTEFAKQQGITSLEAWDIAYYSEKLRLHRYAISEEDLRPYFPEDTVLSGLFKIFNQLYGVIIEEVQGIDVWADNVRFFVVYDEQGAIRGQFYLDLYSRPNKRGGAWIDSCRHRHRFANDQLQYPVAYIICNFAGRNADGHSLLTHDEVLTLFHEFGHSMHHMMTQIDFGSISGINGVAWDAVELPSQLMENFAWEREVLDGISCHYQTKEKLPDALYQKMLAAKNFQIGMQTVRQLEFALFDMRLHAEFDGTKPDLIKTILGEVRAKVAVVPAPAFNRFAHGFAHIFAGGYCAGYYSYQWADVLASDAYAKFEENGILNPETGRQFLHHILEMGGSKEAMDLFVAFRGRKPSMDALLRQRGVRS